jgi:hypothetical protein
MHDLKCTGSSLTQITKSKVTYSVRNFHRNVQIPPCVQYIQSSKNIDMDNAIFSENESSRETVPLPGERTTSCWRRLRDLDASLQRRAAECWTAPKMPTIVSNFYFEKVNWYQSFGWKDLGWCMVELCLVWNEFVFEKTIFGKFTS